MIDTVALRKRILDLAIQGLLTSDVEIDEGVLDKINCILSKKDIDNYIASSEILFEIKSTWSWIKLGWIMGIERGGSPRPIKAYITEAEDGINWIKIGDVSKDGKYIERTKEKIKLEGEKKSRHVYPGDFLLTNSMSFGRPYISKIDGCVHDGWLILRNEEELFDMDFLYYLLSSSYAYNQFSKKASGATVDNLNIDKVADAVIPLPPIEEQKIIVEKVEKMMKYVEDITNLQSQYSSDLEVLKSKIIDAGIQGKLTEQLPEDGTAEELLEQIAEEKKLLIKEKKIKVSKELPEIIEDEIPFAIPDNWKWCRLVDLCREVTDGTHKTPTYIETGIPFLSVKNVSSGHFDFEDVKYISESEHRELIKRCNPEKGDILFCRIGTLGKAIEIDFNADFSIFVSLGLIKPLDSYLSKYLVYVLNSGFGEKWIKKNKAGDAMHAAKINLDVLRSFLIPLPPLLEQTRIVDKIDEMLSIVQR